MTKMTKMTRSFTPAYIIRSLFALVMAFLVYGNMTVRPQQAAAMQNTKDVNVTSTINDAANGYALQIQSDGVGAYTNSRYVQSIIQGIGDWVLDTNYSSLSTRSVWLDFAKPVAGSGPNGGNPVAPFNAGLAKVRFITRCSQYGVNMFTIQSGSTVYCGLRYSFSYGGNDYALQMNPVNGVDVSPETDFVDVTCQAVNASSQCINWAIAPNGAKGGCATPDCSVKQNIVRLEKIVTVKGKKTQLNQGDFYVAFSINVTNP